MPRSHWWIIAMSSLSLAPRDAGAICREVTERGSSPPAILPDQEMVIIRRTDVPVGCEPPAGPDAAPPPPSDASPPAPPDAAQPSDAAPADAAAPRSDAGPPSSDAAPPDGGACEPRLRDTVTWTVQPRFSIGPRGSRFALLMVTPRAPIVETAPESTFADLARATAPIEVVEERTIEDAALGYQCEDPKFGGAGGAGCTSTVEVSGGGGWTPPDSSGGSAADASTIDGYVPVLTVGSYQVVVLAATDADALAEWLEAADYEPAPEDIDAIRPYLELGWIVTAVRVTSDEAVHGGGLEPLSFTFEGDDLRLPLGVARQPEGGRALLKIYVAAEGRYEVPGARLTYAGWTPDPEATFLTASLLDVELSRTAEEDPVIARAFADITYQDEYTLVREIRIPSSYCPSRSDGLGLCDCRTGGGRASQAGTLLLAVACAAVVLRRRPRRPRRS